MSEETTLDAELATLLDAGRSETLTPAIKSSVRSAVARRIAMPYVVGGVGAVGLAILVVLWWPSSGEEPAPQARRPAPVLVAPVAAPQAPPPPAPVTAPVAPAPPTPRVAAPPSPPPPAMRRAIATPATATSETESPPRSTLQQEVALLTAAHRSLEQGQPRAALGPLDEHTQRFPEGVLQLDRDAARWVARCELDPSAHVSGLAFAARHPRVPIADRIRAVCTGDNP